MVADRKSSIIETLTAKVEYCFELKRKESFKSWFFKDNKNCSAAKLAEAGFIFTGNDQDDSVTCFMCNKSLDCWEEDDDPWLEHQKHAPHCSFAKMHKPEGALTLSELIDLRNELIESVIRTCSENQKKELNKAIDDIIETV